MQVSSGGPLGFLDGLAQAAVNASAAVAEVKANLRGAKTSDQTEVGGTSLLQSAPGKIPAVWLIGGGLAAVVVVILLLRK